MDPAPLNVPRLRVLFELTRRGSVSAVADALWITPSAVSQQLAALEREVGTALVERAGRGVRVTDAGRRLAADAERVLAALDTAQSTAREIGTGDAGVRVAAYPSVVLGVLAPALATLSGVRVEILDAEGIAGLDHVRLGRADVAIVDDWGSDLAPDGLAVTPLLTDRLHVVLPAAHPLAAADVVRWSDLAREDWVVEPGRSLFAGQVAEQCRRAGFEPRVRATIRDLAAQLALVEALGLVTVLPRTAIPAPTVCRPLVPELRRDLFVVSRADVAGTPAVTALVRALFRQATGQTD